MIKSFYRRAAVASWLLMLSGCHGGNEAHRQQPAVPANVAPGKIVLWVETPTYSGSAGGFMSWTRPKAQSSSFRGNRASNGRKNRSIVTKRQQQLPAMTNLLRNVLSICLVRPCAFGCQREPAKSFTKRFIRGAPKRRTGARLDAGYGGRTRDLSL